MGNALRIPWQGPVLVCSSRRGARPGRASFDETPHAERGSHQPARARGTVGARIGVRRAGAQRIHPLARSGVVRLAPVGRRHRAHGFDPLAVALFEAIVEGAYVVANADGVFDDEERRMFERVVIAACGETVAPQQIAALVADFGDQLEEDGGTAASRRSRGR